MEGADCINTLPTHQIKRTELDSRISTQHLPPPPPYMYHTQLTTPSCHIGKSRGIKTAFYEHRYRVSPIRPTAQPERPAKEFGILRRLAVTTSIDNRYLSTIDMRLELL